MKSTIIQGYFPRGSAILPSGSAPKTAAHSPAKAGRAPTYQELAVQAHQRSSGLTVQSFGTRNAFVVPPHLASFGRRAGQKLPPAVQQKMESFFGADFSDVQVHSGPEASAIGALAFTQGSSIYFAPGQYNPNSHFGQQLLAHELTHVVQQRAGRVRNPFGSGIAVVQDPMLEAEAEQMGRQAAMQATAPPRLFRFAQARFRAPIQRSADPVETSLENVRNYSPNTWDHYGNETIRRVLTATGLRVRGHHSGGAGDSQNAATTQDLEKLIEALQADAKKKKAVPEEEESAPSSSSVPSKKSAGKHHTKEEQKASEQKKQDDRIAVAKKKFRAFHEGAGHVVSADGTRCTTCGEHLKVKG